MPLAVNGCYRTADHVLLGTVSNWVGSAFEMAAHALHPPSAGSEGDYVCALQAAGLSLADLEAAVLDAMTAPPACSVDGVHPERDRSVDGMPWEPHHRQLLDLLWRAAVRGAHTVQVGHT